MPSANGHGPKRAILYARVSSAEQVLGYSIRQQVDRGREWCAEYGYEVLAVFTDEGESAQFLERDGLDEVRDLVEADPGKVAIVWAQDADRITRDPAHRAFLDAEFERFGTRLFALDDWGDDSHEGELLKYMKGWVAKGERLKTAERMRRGKMQKAKEGKVVATHAPRYGFRFLKNDKGRAYAYEVREDQMGVVRSIFRMVGEEGLTLYAARKRLEATGIPSPGGKELWHQGYLRNMILDDIYRPHTYSELTGLVSEQVAAGLDPEKRYGVCYYDKRRQTRKKVAAAPNGDGRRYRYAYTSEAKPRESWVAVPVPDPAVPREWVDCAREAIANNRRPSSAGLRFWELSGGVLRCASCGRSMQTTSIRSTTGRTHHYYRCPKRVRDGEAGCGNRKNIRADHAEPLVWEKISELLKDPERLRVGLEAMIEEKKCRASRDPGREAVSWHKRLAECAKL